MGCPLGPLPQQASEEFGSQGFQGSTLSFVLLPENNVTETGADSGTTGCGIPERNFRSPTSGILRLLSPLHPLPAQEQNQSAQHQIHAQALLKATLPS